MKIGDLIRVKERWVSEIFWLYEGESKCWDDNKNVVFSSITFGASETGIVIMKRKMDPGGRAYVKLLTSRGLGWIFSLYVETIQSRPRQHRRKLKQPLQCFDVQTIQPHGRK